MRIPRIYTPQSLSLEQEVELEEDSSHHLLKVLRMEAPRELILFNGQGGEYKAQLRRCGKKMASAQPYEFVDLDRESPLHTQLAIGISRGERFDFVLQKATELGITHITPLLTERCEVRLSAEREEKRLVSWRKIIISACEQCGRNRLPELAAPQNFNEFLVSAKADLKLVLHHRSSRSLDEYSQPSSCILLVGPEGGLSDTEIASAERHDFQALSLGPRILRTETAPITALSALQFLWGDL